MPPKPAGPRALTNAERQAKDRANKAAERARHIAALERILTAKTVREARAIARVALGRDADGR